MCRTEWGEKYCRRGLNTRRDSSTVAVDVSVDVEDIQHAGEGEEGDCKVVRKVERGCGDGSGLVAWACGVVPQGSSLPPSLGWSCLPNALGGDYLLCLGWC